MQNFALVVVRRVSDGKSLDLFGNQYAPPSSPSWSPDGRALVVEQLNHIGSAFVEGLEVLNYAAMLASPHPSTKIATPLTNDPAHSYVRPIYSPDGRWIACVRTALGATSGDLWIMRADGSGGHAIAHDAHDDRPAWSPDGAAIAYTRGGSVAIVDTSGTALGTVADATGPAWGGRVSLQPVASAPVATAAPSAAATATALPAASTTAAPPTIVNSALFHTVAGRYQATRTIHVGENVLFAVYYRVAGAAQPAQGVINLIYNNRALHTYTLTAGTDAAGERVLTIHLIFPPTRGLQATPMAARFTVWTSGGTASTTQPFTLEP